MIAALFALFAWTLRGVTLSGALAGFGLAFALYAAGGWPMFALLVFVFVLTWAATRIGQARKSGAGLAERPGGRTAAQVVANVGWAAVLLAIPLRPGYHALAQVGALAVLAEAAADTCASEIGKPLARHTVLLTSFRSVPAGTDGGISGVGSLTALLAATLTALAAAVFGLLPLASALVWVVPAATAATFVDSLLGATLERRGWLNNDAVNLLGTATAATLAPGLLLLVFGLTRS